MMSLTLYFAHILVGNHGHGVAHACCDRIRQRTDVISRVNHYIQQPWIADCLRADTDDFYGIDAVAVDDRAVARRNYSRCDG